MEGAPRTNRQRRPARTQKTTDSDDHIDLGLALYPPDHTESVARVDWCSRDGSKFRGNMIRGSIVGDAFGDIAELCEFAGVNPDDGLQGWTFGLNRKSLGDSPTGQPVNEPSGQFDGRALATRVAAFIAASNIVFKEKCKPPRVSVLAPFIVPAGTASAKPPIPKFIGSVSKRADTRKRAVASASRSDPAPLVAPTHGVGVVTAQMPKGKRQREPRPTSRAPGTQGQTDAAETVVYEYASAADMFAVWYDLNNDEHGCDHAVSAEHAWDKILPATHSDEHEKWCRAYWEKAYAEDAARAYESRAHFVVGADGRRVRFDMAAPGVPVTPTVEELAMAFYSDAHGTVVDPHNVVYARWDQTLLDRWFRRSTRWSTLDADPVLAAIVGRRWMMGNHARYLCAWARPETGVNGRRLVRAPARTAATTSTPPSPASGDIVGAKEDAAEVRPAASAEDGGDQMTTWHTAVILCQNARYDAIVKAYDARLRARALEAVDVFLARMEAAGHGELIEMLRVEARIALYRLGILNKRTDGPPPQSLCTFAPGYCMATREYLMSVVPPPPARAPTTQTLPREPDSRRAFDALMGTAKGGDDAMSIVAVGGTVGAVDPMDEVRAQRRAQVARGARAKRLIRREWKRVERRNILAEAEVDQESDEDDDDDQDDDGVRVVKPDPFWSSIEQRMRLLDLVE